MIYLDEQATTPLAPEALAAMLPWLGGPQTQGFANPHSPHKSGRAAAAAVAVARDQVAGLFPPGGTVVFTSGATEAINLAMLGLNPRRLAVSAIEHAAVLDTAAFMARGGAEVATLPVSPAGLVASDALIAPGTALVAVMQVNNEIGTIQPVDAIVRIKMDHHAATRAVKTEAANTVLLVHDSTLLISSFFKRVLLAPL